jgi:hypothetical protein
MAYPGLGVKGWPLGPVGTESEQDTQSGTISAQLNTRYHLRPIKYLGAARVSIDRCVITSEHLTDTQLKPLQRLIRGRQRLMC